MFANLVIFAFNKRTIMVKEIIDKFYPCDDELKRIFLIHARKVADLSLEMAARHPELGLDVEFLEEAALLHDLGIFMCDAPRIHCHGDKPYICHGYLGAELLRSMGYPRHAAVCERHTGTGLTKELIEREGWPLPLKDFTPVTLEEQLICFADKFYSKTKHLEQARTLEQVRESMRKISDEAVEKIDFWAKIFM